MKASKYLVAALLMLFFSGKVVIPVFEHIKTGEKVITEKQEEKSDEKSENTKTEAMEISICHSSFSFHKVRSSYFDIAHTFLAVQYFAIPTPPPWC